MHRRCTRWTSSATALIQDTLAVGPVWECEPSGLCQEWSAGACRFSVATSQRPQWPIMSRPETGRRTSNGRSSRRVANPARTSTPSCFPRTPSGAPIATQRHRRSSRHRARRWSTANRPRPGERRSHGRRPHFDRRFRPLPCEVIRCRRHSPSLRQHAHDAVITANAPRCRASDPGLFGRI